MRLSSLALFAALRGDPWSTVMLSGQVVDGLDSNEGYNGRCKPDSLLT